MATITNIRPKKAKLRLVGPPNTDNDLLISILQSAVFSAKKARAHPGHIQTHLRNCRDALIRAGFFIDDELSK